MGRAVLKQQHSRQRPAQLWDIGNYYKHRDEWSVEVWREKRRGEKDGPLRQNRRTRRSVQRVGIVHNSTGNMRTAYEF
jgi:hypothetical protein